MAGIFILSGISLAGGASFAAEFEVLDRFSVDGYTVLRGSADIPGGSFAVGGSAFVIKGGNVGIGTAGPGTKLDVQQTDTAQAYSVKIGTSPTAYHMVVSTSGNVGIGTTNPAANLEVAGGIKLGGVTACTSETAGTLRWLDGHISVCNGTAWRQLDNQPPPTITSITPASGLYNIQTAITIDGTGFNPGPEVLIDGFTAIGITVVSTTRITATATASSTGTGTKAVKLTNPDGQYVTGTFTYNPLPTVAAVSPATGSGLGGTPVTITGTGFAAAVSDVKIGGVAATSVVRISETEIRATTPAGSAAAADVRVTNPDTGSAVKSSGYTYMVYATATNGTSVNSGGYRTHTFTSTGGGTLNVAIGGNVTVLVVAGGGGGGGRYLAGGGGAGGLAYSAAVPVVTQSYAVTVGAGGAGGGNDAVGTNGGSSSFATITASGGGGGSSHYAGAGKAGGSGGGGSTNYPTPGTGVSGQGYSGGAGYTTPNYGGGGGGGAGGVGAPGTNIAGGAGGVGKDYSGIFGTGVGALGWFAGGGGGSIYSSGTPGTGGMGGGGAGSLGNATSGTANTGGGGGGAERNGPPAESGLGGSGGSGIVIIRYQFE